MNLCNIASDKGNNVMDEKSFFGQHYAIASLSRAASVVCDLDSVVCDLDQCDRGDACNGDLHVGSIGRVRFKPL